MTAAEANIETGGNRPPWARLSTTAALMIGLVAAIIGSVSATWSRQGAVEGLRIRQRPE